MNNTPPTSYNTDPAHTEYLLRVQEMNLEAGSLGRFFGSPQRAASSIAWITIFLLVISGIIALFGTCSIAAPDYWKIITPIITLAFGFLFGKTDK